MAIHFENPTPVRRCLGCGFALEPTETVRCAECVEAARPHPVEAAGPSSPVMEAAHD